MNEKDKNKQKKLAIGNYAVARGAFEAGVTVSSAYPGTPSTEITEFLAKYAEVTAEWSPNEKVAAEVGIGAAVAGARAIVAMKHVGLNVAADPIFTASYTGVNGGLVIAVADDPGVHSSQNEQDSRYYALSAKIPMLEPSDSQEALDFTRLAFDLSERYDTPVFIRMTTRVAHSQSFITEGERQDIPLKPYEKNADKYVMMPAGARARRIAVEERTLALQKDVDAFSINRAELNNTDLGIVCAGGVYQYVKEAAPDASVFKVGSVYPLPLGAVAEFSRRVKRLIVVEELDGFIENALKAAGIACEGKNLISPTGELNAGKVRAALFNAAVPAPSATVGRPPVLCPGCPHRGMFAVINKLRLNVFGDIGCYTLGAMPPLNALDTVICMGASIGMAIGAEKARGREFAKKSLAVIGDSTFVHSGITGLIDAVYNNLNTKILIVDNSTTGMTGHQPHPGTGRTIYDEPTYKLDFADVARACGVKNIAVVNALDIKAAEAEIKRQLSLDGVSLIIAKEPCALLGKQKRPPFAVTSGCKNCKACVRIGCPAIVNRPDAPVIDAALCSGCGLCARVCPFKAIAGEGV
ncbi:MAG: indolepyruvate ferredoxin oxidoreductase subunit alpha [Clostridiales bacterium]|nr:indolepyruvate ferredoxin oxidoreductase subunit alpha [Clostridiales bacterium]